MHYTFVESDTFETIETFCRNFNENTLCIWDVDGTLIYPNEVIFYPQHCKFKIQYDLICRCNLVKAQKLTQDQLLNIWYEAWHSVPFCLMDERFVELIHKLQARQVPNMALTMLLTKRGSRDYLQWRLDQLRALNIDFSSTFKQVKEFYLPEALEQEKQQTEPREGCGVPGYKEGVLCTHHCNKDFALDAFLKRLNNTPKQIFFVDDVAENVRRIGQFCQKHAIDFIGIHFTAIKHLPNANNWSESEAVHKWATFLTSGQWPLTPNTPGVVVL